MTSDDFNKAQAALFAWRVEGDQSANAMLAVLFVLRRRVEKYNLTWLEVIAEAEQEHRDSRFDKRFLRLPDTREPAFEDVLHYIDSVYDGSRPDNLTGEAMYWARPSERRNNSVTELVVTHQDEHPRCGQVGKTSFYK